MSEHLRNAEAIPDTAVSNPEEAHAMALAGDDKRTRERHARQGRVILEAMEEREDEITEEKIVEASGAAIEEAKASGDLGRAELLRGDYEQLVARLGYYGCLPGGEIDSLNTIRFLKASEEDYALNADKAERGSVAPSSGNEEHSSAPVTSSDPQRKRWWRR